MVAGELAPIIFIVGPTASGKSSLGLELARRVGGEIICADSQTVRKGLDIGTAKPTPQERQEIPHHLLDVVEPYDKFSVADFKQRAEAAVDDIRRRGKVPIIVGGTGLYIDAVFYDYTLEGGTQTDTQQLEGLTVPELQQLIDNRGYGLPENAQNPRHLIGVLRRGGIYPKDRQKPREDASIYGLQWEDEVLKKRIAERVELMFEHGFLGEVRQLVVKYGRPPQKMDAIGYPIAMRYLDGEIRLEEAKELFKRGDWQYARRQKSWFKRNQHIHWLKPSDEPLEHILQVFNQL